MMKVKKRWKPENVSAKVPFSQALCKRIVKKVLFGKVFSALEFNKEGKQMPKADRFLKAAKTYFEVSSMEKYFKTHFGLMSSIVELCKLEQEKPCLDMQSKEKVLELKKKIQEDPKFQKKVKKQSETKGDACLDMGMVKDLFLDSNNPNFSSEDLLNLQINKEGKIKFVVKVVLTDFAGAKQIKNLQRAFKFARTKYGAYHMALIVGPYFIEWGYGSIVKPRLQILSSSAIFCGDVTSDSSFRTFEEIMDILNVVSKFSYDYSLNMRYNRIHCNCQTFGKGLLKCLGMEMKNDGFKKFIKRAMKTGEMSMFFEYKCMDDESDSSNSSAEEEDEEKKK